MKWKITILSIIAIIEVIINKSNSKNHKFKKTLSEKYFFKVLRAISKNLI